MIKKKDIKKLQCLYEGDSSFSFFIKGGMWEGKRDLKPKRIVHKDANLHFLN